MVSAAQTGTRPQFSFVGTVAWSETDASERFHFAAALCWAENAEHAFYRSAGITAETIGSLPRRAVTASYLRGFAAGDAYEVRLSVERLGTTSVTYSWTIHDASGTVCVEGSHTAVNLDEHDRPAAWSDLMHRTLSALIAR